jgi:hypothetical protein
MNCIDKLNLTIEAINENSNSRDLKIKFNKLLKEVGISTKRIGESRTYNDLI